jgi:hypothetical protein
MAMTAGGALESRTRVKTQRAAESRAYVRKLLSQREPEFAAALTGAVRYISGCFGALDEQLHGRNVLGQQVEIDRRQHDGVASVDDQDRLIDRRQSHEALAARCGEEVVRDQAALRREIAAAAIATTQIHDELRRLLAELTAARARAGFRSVTTAWAVRIRLAAPAWSASRTGWKPSAGT